MNRKQVNGAGDFLLILLGEKICKCHYSIQFRVELNFN